jgi:hypothetical protein
VKPPERLKTNRSEAMRTRFATFIPLSIALLAGCGAGAPPGATESSLLLPPGGIIPIPIWPPPWMVQQCFDEAFNQIISKSISLLNTAPGALGGATGDIETIRACGAYRRRFQYGSIFYVSGQSEAYSVHGEIAAKYANLGEQNSALGYPVTDETGTPDGIGRYNHFERGSIYWKPSIGPHALWGAVRDAWASKGWERNADLGYPITDLFSAGPGGADQMVSFENGVVYKVSSNPNAEILIGTVFGYDADKVKSTIQDMVNKQLGSNGYVESVDPISVSDYSRDGLDYVRNRHFSITLHNHYNTPWPLPDGWGTLTLNIEIFLNRGASEVDFYLLNWSETTTDYAPGVAGSINDKINAALNQLGGAQKMQSVPSLVNEVKPMLDGSLNVYISPFN